MFHLHICGCDESCWADKKNATLHRLRLGISERLAIPMHEVHELDLSFVRVSRDPRVPSLSRLHITISSPRHTVDSGALLFRSLFKNVETSSEALTMLVLGIKEISPSALGFLHKYKRNKKVVSEDPFAP